MTPAVIAAFEWLPLDTWIVMVGALSAAACALLGSFLVLRKMSLMGDAISHAVLPGLALAFLLSGSRSGVVMLVGAGLVGLLTTLFTEWVHRTGKVEQGAAMGVVFTVLFAIGLILIRLSADHVDLDPDCVLYGAIELTPLDTLRIGSWDVPRAVLVGGGVLLLNTLVIALLYKELKISAFDPALATTLGINARLMHYLLMTLVAITTVAAFESVGSILVIAMLIVPAATAHLLTDRLSLMLLVSVLLAVASALVGHLAAILAPGWFGLTGVSTNTAGMMAALSGLLFGLTMVFAPRRGLLSRLWQRADLALRIAREDLLGILFRLEESGRPPRYRAQGLLRRLAVWQLGRRGSVLAVGGTTQLTERGRLEAAGLVRSHRLWEAYFGTHTSLGPDHIHHPAERLEHVTDAGLQRRLATSLGDPVTDPHGAVIPPADKPAPSAEKSLPPKATGRRLEQ